MGVEILDHADQPLGADDQIARPLAGKRQIRARQPGTRAGILSADDGVQTAEQADPQQRRLVFLRAFVQARSRLMRRDSVEGSTPMMRARWAWLTPSNSAAFMAASSTTCPVSGSGRTAVRAMYTSSRRNIRPQTLQLQVPASEAACYVVA